MSRRPAIIVALLAVTLTLAACTTGNEAVREDQATAAANLDRLNDAQPVPEFTWSQLRQNLIDITKSQADTTQTTAFFFNMGVQNPVAVCPSIGFPIPTTAQLTNPNQAVRVGTAGDRHVLPQVEQTGVYTGDSTGTYVICVDAEGNAYAQYWEGFVATVAGPAEWDSVAGRIELIGPPSFDYSEGR